MAVLTFFFGPLLIIDGSKTAHWNAFRKLSSMLSSTATSSPSGSAGVRDRLRQCRQPPEPGLPLPLNLPQVTGQGLQWLLI
jgi:hypothetical protein